MYRRKGLRENILTIIINEYLIHINRYKSYGCIKVVHFYKNAIYLELVLHFHGQTHFMSGSKVLF